MLRGDMAKPLPTDAELEILRVLWRRGPSTVRDVHGELAANGTGYTTALKQLQVMFDKGLVKRDDSNRSHVYRPALPEEQTQRKILGSLIERAFSGSSAQLAMRALSTKPATAEELEQIRALIDDMASRGGQK
jgi:BlaI family penicillinase repressor